MSKLPNRRKFLRNTALAAGLGLGGVGGFNIIRGSASQGQGEKKPLVGHNGYTYQPDLKWGNQDCADYPVHHCHEMVMDDQGRLILCTTEKKNNVLIYNKDGKVMSSWTHQLPEPHGLTITGEGSDQTLWLTDSTLGRVINCRLDGRIIRELELPGDALPAGQAYKPTETTVTPAGDIYVADGYGSNLILHYNAHGQFVKAFGGPDHFDCAHGIVYDHRTAKPSLLITSRGANNFQRWTLDGEHLETRSLPGLSICRPVIKDEMTYFAVIVTKSWWSYDGMVAVLDKDMRVVSLPGGSSPDRQDDFTGVEHDNTTFMNPHDVCVDDDDNLYVPQWLSGKTYPVRLRRV